MKGEKEKSWPGFEKGRCKSRKPFRYICNKCNLTWWDDCMSVGFFFHRFPFRFSSFLSTSPIPRLSIFSHIPSFPPLFASLAHPRPYSPHLPKGLLLILLCNKTLLFILRHLSSLKKMLQGEDEPQEPLQAIRAIDKSHPPNLVTPASPDEIFHIEIRADPKTQKDVVLWEDIVLAFEYAVQVRHKSKIVPFLKGSDFITYVHQDSSFVTMNVKVKRKHPNVSIFPFMLWKNERLALNPAELLQCRTPFWMWL